MVKFVNLWQKIKETSYFLYMFIGGRGIGKTYSVLKGLLESGEKIMYVRRTETELAASFTSENNPFLRLSIDLGIKINCKTVGKDSFQILKDDEIIGIAGAISTFGKFRGSDYTGYNYIVFDEFTAKLGQAKIKNEDIKFFDMIETVNRNRELLGYPPVKVILLSNANSLDNPIIRELKLGEIIHQLKESKSESKIYTDENRGIYLELLDNREVSAAKRKTALYKLTQGTQYYRMAIDNDFVDDDFSDVKKVKQNQLIPLCTFDDVYIYTSKVDKKIYVTNKKNNSKRNIYQKGQEKNFRESWGIVWAKALINNTFIFSDYDTKLKFLNLIMKG